MSFTLQVGTAANWVGSHYWSALKHRTAISDEDVVSLYNEDAHGDFYPRMFLVDSPDALGKIDLHTEEEPSSSAFAEMKVEKFELSPPNSRPNEYNFWTDFWELENFPKGSYILPRKLVPTEHSNKFWFEYPALGQDQIDELRIRAVVEETDVAVHDIRVLSDPSCAMTEHSVALGDYLLNSCFAKSAMTMLVSPTQEVCAQINLAHMIHEASDYANCLMVPFSQLDFSATNLLHASAVEAVWLESGFASAKSCTLAEPCLSIDDAILLGTPPFERSLAGFTKNIANPLSITPASVVSSGTRSLGTRMLCELQQSVRRFVKEGKGIYHQFSDRIEEEEFAEISETLAALIQQDIF